MNDMKLRTRHLKTPSYGFTLLEIMIVLAIVVILGGMGWNGYRHIIQKAGRSEGRAALLQLLLQEERHFSHQHRYQGFTAGSGTGGFKWYSGATPETSAYALSARACDGETLSTCVLLKANPGAEGVNRNYGDTECGALYLDSRGGRRADGKDCW